MDILVDPTRPSTHFDFGRNWAAYAADLPNDAIDRASEGLERLGLSDLNDRTFLDIGCGSGVHALAAMKKGASVICIDVDNDSVATANALFVSGGFPPVARQQSILDGDVKNLGKFDIVYSWGVLHHTGDVWRAIESAAELVALGGVFAIALYEKAPLCGLWEKEKHFYAKAGPLVRRLIRYPFGAARLLASCLLRRVSPLSMIRHYNADRGMDFWRDADDWLGGYPYQSTRADEVIGFVEALGLRLRHKSVVRPSLGVFGTGCSEFVFNARA
ncbi:class I SAM-dependent methyltransferase [Sphingomonas sp.]|uniref:class I SAM-dependent methyltransferase n=1 Tax=Sphingomonas sp. TaxID=28214 RepID=UPI003B000FB6